MVYYHGTEQEYIARQTAGLTPDYPPTPEEEAAAKAWLEAHAAQQAAVAPAEVDADEISF